MTDKIIDIFIAVFSGVLSSGVVFIIVWTFQKVLIPNYQDMVYQGVRTAGKWRSEVPAEKIDSDKSKVENILDINQSGHTISGTITKVSIFKEPNNEQPRAQGPKTYSEVFNIAGKIKDRFFIGTVGSRLGDRIAASPFVFEVTGDGRRMNGGQAFFNVGTNKIDTKEREWKKEESTAADKIDLFSGSAR